MLPNGIVTAIKCYQCSAAEAIDCSDGMIHMGGIQPQSCEHVFEAEYCIKSVSLDGNMKWIIMWSVNSCRTQ